jgi:MinD-like ATPase involved in chromosome partitioning or flagellar assembly
MPILCQPPGSTAELTGSIGDAVSAADDLAATAQMLDADPAEVLVVVGPGTAADHALDFTAKLRLARPAVGVVLVRDQLDVTMLNRALQSGVREVVRAGDRAALAAACRRSRELSRRLLAAAGTGEAAPVRDGKVITVFSAKGGCGKTTLATNLGVVLSRHDGRRACVVDLDLAFGDVAITVKLAPVRTIMDALPMAGHLDTTGAASLLTSDRPGLEMLLAPVTPGDAEKVPPSLVGDLLSVLRGMFDYVVVDTPPQLSEHVLTALDASALHVLLTASDVPSLKNLRLTLDMLDLLSYPREIRTVVLNRSDARAGLIAQDVERVARWPIAGHIPSSRAVPVSINEGVPITLANPGHHVSQAITRFAEQWLLPQPEPARSGGLFRPRGRRRS